MFHRSLVAVLFVGLACGVVQAQQRGVPSLFSISGRVVVPVAGFQDYFEVLLLQNAEQTVAYTYADSNGRYRFTNLSRGSYFISIKLDGFEEVRQRVDVGGGGTETIMNIILDFKQERTVQRPPDLSGEDAEVVDIAELNRKYPSKIVDQYEEAQEDIRKGNMLKAQQSLEAVLLEAPDFYFAHKTLGELHQKAGRFRDAETEYKQARDLRPNSASPLVNLGSLYIQEADASGRLGHSVVRKILDQALDSLEVAVKLNPAAPFAFYLLGVGYYKSAFYEDAEDNLKRALQMAPRLAHARLALANVYIKMEEWPNAIAQLDAFLAENPRAIERADVEAARAKVAQRVERPTIQRP
jgi:predicted Zn-dependent protease